MTPWAGFVAAIVAGWIVRDPRRAVATVIVPFLVVLATQSWMIAAGRAVSPPSTVTQFPSCLGYWIIQAIFLALALGIAAELQFPAQGAPRGVGPGREGLGPAGRPDRGVRGRVPAGFVPGAGPFGERGTAGSGRGRDPAVRRYLCRAQRADHQGAEGHRGPAGGQRRRLNRGGSTLTIFLQVRKGKP